MMRYLNFSEDFMEKIKRGEKKATLRLGVKDYKVGERVIIKCGNKELGMAEIKEINIKKFRELEDKDVLMDGYISKDALRKDLERFYGKISDEDIFTQIIFDMIEAR